MNVKITKPKDYDDGAFHISALLEQNEKLCYDQCPVFFEIPELANRFFRQLQGYRIAVVLPDGGIKLHGIFNDGVWQSDFYTNGVSEQDNMTPISAVKHAVEQNIKTAITTAISWCDIQNKL
jgi:hypothetical protein